MARRTWPPRSQIPEGAARRILRRYGAREAARQEAVDARRARDAALLAALRDGGISGPEAASATGTPRASRVVKQVRDEAGLSHASPALLQAIAGVQRELVFARRERTREAVAVASRRRRQLVLEGLMSGGIMCKELAGATGTTEQAAHKLIQAVRGQAGLPRRARPERLAAIAEAQRALDAAQEKARQADAALRAAIDATHPMSHRALAGLLNVNLDAARRLRGGHRRPKT